MFFSAPNWTGGIYGSPTMAGNLYSFNTINKRVLLITIIKGSRPGGLIAAAWGTLVSIGEDGYLAKAEGIMQASREILAG